VGVGDDVFVNVGVAVGASLKPQADKARPKDVAPVSLRKSRLDSGLEFIIVIPI
jgi:hypothetical protein